MNGQNVNGPLGMHLGRAAGVNAHHPLVRWTILLLGLLAIGLLGGCFVWVHDHSHSHWPHRTYEYEYRERHGDDRQDIEREDREARSGEIRHEEHYERIVR